MSKPRKTVEAARLVERLNVAIGAREGHTEAQKALCWATEAVLQEANAYNGFQWYRGGKQVTGAEARAMDPDSPHYYSRHYYAPRKAS